MVGIDGPDGLSIVVPTYMEQDNAERLLTRLAAVRSLLPANLEILVVVDNSPDGTVGAFRTHGESQGLPVRVILRTGQRSLGRSILAGVEQSRASLVCVMDADLSHPPEDIPRMISLLDGADGVVASRYTEGGGIASWPWHRRVISRGATAFAKTLIRSECTDPVSGFFLFRRASLVGLGLTGVGNKPLLEILAAKPTTIHELPYEFVDRARGRSKLGLLGIGSFAHLLVLLALKTVRSTFGKTAADSDAAIRARDP